MKCGGAASIALCLSIVLFLVLQYGFGGEREQIVISRVIDGDTVELEDGRTIRLLNINTPEKGTFGAELSTSYLEKLANVQSELEITGTEKYGRLLGRVYHDATYINYELVSQGYAQIFLVDASERRMFKEVQERAVRESKGIWEHSPDYRCLSAILNKEEEFVLLEKNCPISVKGWMLKDESTKVYVFDTDLPKETILYSGKGKNTENERFWGEGNVWNNDRDTLVIRDDSGFLVFYSSYGY